MRGARVTHIGRSHARARPARAAWSVQRLVAARWCCRRRRRRHFVLADCWSWIPGRRWSSGDPVMTTSASMVAAPIERRQVRGHRQRSENLQHRQRGRLPSLAQGTGGRGTERSPKFARVTHIGRSHARARPARAAWSVQRLVAARWCCRRRRRRHFVLADCWSWIPGRRWSSGDPVMTTSASMVAAPIERRQVRGHRQRSENLQHRQRGRLPSLAQGTGGRGTERSPKFARVTHIGRSHARARPARAAWSVQRLVAARWCCRRRRRRHFVLADCWSWIPGRRWSSGDPVMTTSASMVAAPIERRQVRGHRQRSENLQHRQRGRLPSLAQGTGGRGTERSPKFARVTHIGRSHARARPARAAWSVQRLVAARWCCRRRRRRHFVLADCWSWIPGRRWSSGDPVMTTSASMVAAPIERRQVRGHRQRSENLQHRQRGRLPSLAQGTGGRGTERSPKFARVTHIGRSHARARPARAAWSVQRLVAARWCCRRRRRRHFVLADCWSWIPGRRWSSGDPVMTTSASMVAAPIERRQVRGHRQRSENLQHRQRGRLPSLAQGTGGRGTERSPKFARVTHIGRSHARARPARAAWSVQRLVAARWCCRRRRRRHFVLADCWSWIPGRRWSSGDPVMTTSASMVAAPIERRQVRGHRQRSENLQHRQRGRLPSLAQGTGGRGTERSPKFARVTHIGRSHARARPARAAWSVQRLVAARWCCRRRRRRHFVLADCWSWIPGRRWSSGDPVMTTSASMVAAPIERRQVRGHRQRSENLQHRQRGRLPSLAQGTGGRGTERSPKFARVTHIGRSHARARPARAAWSVQRLVAARWCCRRRRRRHFVLADCWS